MNSIRRLKVLLNKSKTSELCSHELLAYIRELLNTNCTTSFVIDRIHIYNIYRDRLEMSRNLTYEHYDGLEETVSNLYLSDLRNVKVSEIEIGDKSCLLFTDEDVSLVIGIIFYDE